MLLVDASVPTQNVDLGCAEWMYNNQVPFSLVFTKADKRKKKCPLPAQNIADFEVSPASESCTTLNISSVHIQLLVPAASFWNRLNVYAAFLSTRCYLCRSNLEKSWANSLLRW